MVQVEVASFMGEHSHHGEGTPADCGSSSSIGQAVGGQKCKVPLQQCSYSGNNKLREEQGRESNASNVKHVLFPGQPLSGAIRGAYPWGGERCSGRTIQG